MHPPTTDTYTLSLHDALPIFPARGRRVAPHCSRRGGDGLRRLPPPRRPAPRRERSGGKDRPTGTDRPIPRDRKSTRLNSSHRCISYAVFCLKKKKKKLRQKHN